MVLENVLADTILFAVITGSIISGIAALGAIKTKFSKRKLLYSVGLASISSLVIVDVANGGVTQANAVPLFLEVVGLSYLGNKLFNIGNKVKNGVTNTPTTS